MIQKVLKVGSSAAVTLPKKALAELGLEVGDSISLSIDAKAKKVLIEPHGVIDQDTLAWGRSFVKKYRVALKALAK